MEEASGLAMRRSCERHRVVDMSFNGLKSAVRLVARDGGAFLIASDGAVQCVDVGLDGLANFGAGLRDQAFHVRGCVRVASVFRGGAQPLRGGFGNVCLKFFQPFGQIQDLVRIDALAVRIVEFVRVGDDALEVECARLYHLQEVGGRTDLRGQKEDGQVVVGDEALGGARELGANRV